MRHSHAYFIYLDGFIDDAPYTAELPLNQSVSTPSVLILSNVTSLNGLVRHLKKCESAEY